MSDTGRIGIVVRSRPGISSRILRRQLGTLAAIGAGTRLVVMGHEDDARDTAGATVVLDHRSVETGPLYRLYLALTRVFAGDQGLVVLFDDALPHPAVVEAFAGVTKVTASAGPDRHGAIDLLVAPPGALGRVKERVEAAVIADESAPVQHLLTRGGVPMSRAVVDLTVPEAGGWIWPPRHPERSGKITVEVDGLVIEADEVPSPVVEDPR